MTATIRLTGRPGEVEIAVIADRRLVDYALWWPGRPDGWGDVHLGRVTRRVPALGGAFVALAGAADGFLPDRETEQPQAEGTLLVVRIARASLGGKGPRLTALAAERPPAEGAPRLLARGPTPLAELRARHPDAPVTAADPALAAAHSARHVPRADDDDDARAEIEALRGTALALPGGMVATIHPTPALVAIDLDTAQATDRRATRAAAQFAANRAALPRLLHELRLRNLSGAIVIDLAGLPARKRGAFAPEIVAALASDPLKPRFLGFSALGLAEIVRARTRAPLHEQLASPHAAAIDAVAALAARLDGRPGTKLRLVVPPVLARDIAEDAALHDDLARATGHALIVRSDPARTGRDWAIEEI